MRQISREMRSHYGIADDMLDIYKRDALIAEIRAARSELSEGALRQEVFLLCYGDEFSPEQREKILAAIADYWARKEAGQ